MRHSPGRLPLLRMASRIAATMALVAMMFGNGGCASAADPIYQWLVMLAGGPAAPLPAPDTPFAFDVSILAGDPNFLLANRVTQLDVSVSDPLAPTGGVTVRVVDRITGDAVLFQAVLANPAMSPA